MTENVYALPGYSVPSHEPVVAVVDILETALAEARAGRIVGVAIVTVERQPMANVFNYSAEQNSRHSLMAGVLGLSYALGKVAYEGGDE